MTMPESSAENLEALVERLRRTHTQVRINPLFDGALAYSDGETREVPINPDGPDAAQAISILMERERVLTEALEPFVRHLERQARTAWGLDADEIVRLENGRSALSQPNTVSSR